MQKEISKGAAAGAVALVVVAVGLVAYFTMFRQQTIVVENAGFVKAAGPGGRMAPSEIQANKVQVQHASPQ
jgi:hypothetical protein